LSKILLFQNQIENNGKSIEIEAQKNRNPGKNNINISILQSSLIKQSPITYKVPYFQFPGLVNSVSMHAYAGKRLLS